MGHQESSAVFVALSRRRNCCKYSWSSLFVMGKLSPPCPLGPVGAGGCPIEANPPCTMVIQEPIHAYIRLHQEPNVCLVLDLCAATQYPVAQSSRPHDRFRK